MRRLRVVDPITAAKSHATPVASERLGARDAADSPQAPSADVHVSSAKQSAPFTMRTLAALAIPVVLVTLVWALLDRPVAAPEWTGTLRGISYNPSGGYSDKDHEYTDEAHIRADLTQLARITKRIRTYSVARGLDRVPAIAARLGLKVSLGIWVDDNKEQSAREIEKALAVIRSYPRTIDRVFVGNEAIMRGNLTADELAVYLKQVRRAVPRHIEVGTAETQGVWTGNPGLGKHVDFVAVHILPYWVGIPLSEAVEAVPRDVEELKALFPGKPIVIGEAGWPSEGRIRKGAVPSVANQAAFIRRFAAFAAKERYDYYIIEAYDQPWKAGPEGAVGAYWGMFDAARAPKFAFTGEITSLPNWPSFALISVLLTLVAGVLLLRFAPHLPFRGKAFLAGLSGMLATGATAVASSAALEYADFWTYSVFLIVLPVASLAIAVIIAESVELAHALWRTVRRVKAPPAPEFAPRPKVSIHVPCYNEPPGMVIQTLNALAALDYTDYEVVVLDNNTKDEAVWRPVEAHCRALGPRFRFFHLDGVKGFKAGALNEALTRTDPEAELVAVIDSDYQVSPDWLKIATTYFADPKIALVQAPQDYRDDKESLFKAMCYQEYIGFFRIGMVERDEDNAIIQHGTMTLVRKSALEAAGAWAEWCITEDSELGLKLFENGNEAVYIDRSLGRGLMPDTLAAFKSQRYRWAYGAIQILKRHARALFFGGTRLTPAQRYHFVAGWLPWLADALSLLFTIGALVWTVLMAVAPRHFDLPMASLTSIGLALFIAKSLKTFVVYRYRVSPRLRDAAAAAIAGLALSHTVGKAVLTGLVTARKPFLRTPKCETVAPLRQALASASEELLFLLALWSAIAGTALSWGFEEPLAWLWMVMLAVQSMPFACTVTMAWLSARALARTRPAAAAQEALLTDRLAA
jgi:exo-beta-1,3-glucanase (GH17 family)/cellulose synthase/poly-beta-1,6-N-acetylglucosamine synthase-like glycosyltransferase